jgi:broad specificity phosphatase PhoE
MGLKKVYLVRHGETEGNVGGYFQFPDTLLTPAGHKGAEAVAQRFRNIKIDQLVVSPFVRAHQTAEHITKVVGVPITTVDSFHEILQSQQLRGKHFDTQEVANYTTERSVRFVDPSWNDGGAENFFDVLVRVKDAVSFLEQSEAPSILVVSHGNFLRSLIAYLLLNKREDVETNMTVFRSLLRMSNVGISEFYYDEGKWKLFTLNDHAHFAE